MDRDDSTLRGLFSYTWGEMITCSVGCSHTHGAMSLSFREVLVVAHVVAKPGDDIVANIFFKPI